VEYVIFWIERKSVPLDNPNMLLLSGLYPGLHFGSLTVLKKLYTVVPSCMQAKWIKDCLYQAQSGQIPVFAVPPNSPSISECRRVSVLVHSSVSEVGKCQQQFVDGVVLPKDTPDVAEAEGYEP